VSFVGNTLASDARLKTLIQSKPGWFWFLFGGKVDPQKVEQDVQRVIDYYRALGYFKARVSREMSFDEDHQWVTLRFVIDEGPRYMIGSRQFAGNARFASEDLETRLELKPGDYFNLDVMNRDLNMLRDLYGSQGHIFADIAADPRFRFDDPGNLDLIYNIEEGEQFRVGRINVHIAGEFPHTRESVVRNRLSLTTGDIVDIREVRNSERRLKASQLFENDPANGKAPRIVIRPPDLSEAERLASGSVSASVRGQSPDDRAGALRVLDIDVFVPPLVERRVEPAPEGVSGTAR
jgi:outer membrane protein insertion porin family